MFQVNKSDDIRRAISKKKAQVEEFQKDKSRKEADKSFTNDQYDQKIKDLETDISGLEAELKSSTAPASRTHSDND